MLSDLQIKKIRITAASKKQERLPLIFGALSDSTRLCIFRILLKHKNLCVTDISRICELSVAAVSHQLKILEMVGFVTKERRGKTICYELKKGGPMVEIISKLVTGRY